MSIRQQELSSSEAKRKVSDFHLRGCYICEPDDPLRSLLLRRRMCSLRFCRNDSNVVARREKESEVGQDFMVSLMVSRSCTSRDRKCNGISRLGHSPAIIMHDATAIPLNRPRDIDLRAAPSCLPSSSSLRECPSLVYPSTSVASCSCKLRARASAFTSV